MFKISIPKPCFEGWENMLPNEQGRYCNACATTVVDFSVMSDEAVEQYIVINYGQKMCGRFKTTQVQRIVIDLPQNIFHIQLPFWKKFLIAFLIIYGSSFFSIDTTIAGSPYYTSTASYATLQGTPIIKKEKQKKKQRRKRTVIYIKSDPIIFTDIVLGGFGMMDMAQEIHEPPWTDDPDKIPISLPDISTLNKNRGAGPNKTGYAAAEKRNGPNEPAPAPVPQKVEYILPALLAVRNPFSKKKKA